MHASAPGAATSVTTVFDAAAFTINGNWNEDASDDASFQTCEFCKKEPLSSSVFVS
jgi:hypothetical protein